MMITEPWVTISFPAFWGILLLLSPPPTTPERCDTRLILYKTEKYKITDNLFNINHDSTLHIFITNQISIHTLV